MNVILILLHLRIHLIFKDCIGTKYNKKKDKPFRRRIEVVVLLASEKVAVMVGEGVVVSMAKVGRWQSSQVPQTRLSSPSLSAAS